MKVKDDLRVVRTYKLLTEAFLKLMSTKQFEDITVNELCDAAMIRRTTFYKHFSDKFDFFRFFVRQMQADFDTNNPNSAVFLNPKSFFLAILGHTLSFFMEHEKMVQATLGSNMLWTMLGILSEQITVDIASKIRRSQKAGTALPVSPEVMAAFYSGALVHTAMWWINNRARVSEEALFAEFERLFQAMSPPCPGPLV